MSGLYDLNEFRKILKNSLELMKQENLIISNSVCTLKISDSLNVRFVITKYRDNEDVNILCIPIKNGIIDEKVSESQTIPFDKVIREISDLIKKASVSTR